MTMRLVVDRVRDDVKLMTREPRRLGTDLEE